MACFDAQGASLPCPPGVPDGSLTTGSFQLGPFSSGSSSITPNSQGQINTGQGSQVQTSGGGFSLIPQNLTNWLGNPANWKHLGLLLAGLVLVGVGLVAFLSDTSAGKAIAAAA